MGYGGVAGDEWIVNTHTFWGCSTQPGVAAVVAGLTYLAGNKIRQCRK